MPARAHQGSDLARRLALLGATDQEMADALGIDQVTLDRWKTRHKEFRSAIEHGKTQADAEIAESLFNRARGYRHEATKIFMPAGSEAPVYAPYVKHYPPDTNAALAWLSRRQPDNQIAMRSRSLSRIITASRQSKVRPKAAGLREALRSSSRQRLALMASRLCRWHRRR